MHENDYQEIDRVERARQSRMMSEIDRLLAAIRKHRDQRGDDRCWLDDEELYKTLPEGFTAPARDTHVMLEKCKRFLLMRENPATEYVSPEREIERLRAERNEMLITLLNLKRSASCWCDTTLPAEYILHTKYCTAAQELRTKLEKK